MNKLLIIGLIFCCVGATNQIDILKNDIKILQKEYKEKYEGLSDVYIANSSETSSKQLDRFLQYHKERDLLLTNLNIKIYELQRFTNTATNLSSNK